MATVISQPPMAVTSGYTPDAPWQPMAQCGAGNPFFYHVYADDFDYSANVTGIYTKTTTGNGTVAIAAGDGGRALFTTNSSVPVATDVASIQLPAASFGLSATKKVFFVARLQLSDVTNAAMLVGLIQTTATPFTVTDGIYFRKNSGTTALTINHTITSSSTTATIPSGAITLADNTFFELAFVLDGSGEILAYVDSQLVGIIPQSNIGTTNGPNNSGAVSRIIPASLTTVGLNFTLALQSGTTTSKTMTVDFAAAMKER